MLIYKVENKINHKVYIGQTIKTLEERKCEHLKYVHNGKGFRFHKAIRKYGEDNFIWSVIDTASTVEELNQKECYWIEYYKSYINGYNSTKGDSNPMNYKPSKLHHDNVMKSLEVRQKISNTMKQRISKGEFFTKEHRQKISEKLKWNKHFAGHKRTTTAIEATAKSLRKQVSCYDLDGNKVKTFDSVTEAAKWLYNTKCSNYKNLTTLKDLIKRSYVKNKYYYDLLWKYE